MEVARKGEEGAGLLTDSDNDDGEEGHGFDEEKGRVRRAGESEEGLRSSSEEGDTDGARLVETQAKHRVSFRPLFLFGEGCRVC